MKALKKLKLKSVAVSGLLGLGGLMCMTAHGQSRVLPFVVHAEFFSAEAHQNPVLDPQVFLTEPSASAGIGPQGITHIAGVRNARPADPPTLPILNASGKPLDTSLGAWLVANGEVILTPQVNGQEKVTVILSDLKPGGHYSLFENHFDQKPVGFTPLDGTGEANNFVADITGKAVITTIAPAPLTHDNAILVVYHSDGKTYGKSRGDIGVNAHHQLIARP
jgi:hypothetical protein